MEAAIGVRAPAFSLYDTEKKKVSLEDYKGRNVVILFFPLAFTSVCTQELCNVRDNIAVYNDSNAQVLGISVDSVYVLKKFKAEQQLNFPLLSDFNKEAARAFGVLYDTFPGLEMQGVSKRAAFIMDKAGLVQYAEICNTPADMPDFDAIKNKLASLQ